MERFGNGFLSRVIFLFCFLQCLGLSGCTEPKKDTCNLTVEQLPALRGFTLGEDAKEIIKRFPGFRVLLSKFHEHIFVDINVDRDLWVADPSPDGRDSYIKVTASRYPELKGVDKIILQLVDNKVAQIIMQYKSEEFPSPRDFQELDQFLEKVSQSLNIPVGWKTEDIYVKKISCNGFRVVAGFKDGRATVDIADMKTVVLPGLRQRMKDKQKRDSFNP